MIYLIHFEPVVSNKSHYLGVCAEDRLQKRLREHALGNGARLTSRAVAQGAVMYLARVFPNMSFEEEKILKRRSHFKMYCPLCCPLLASGDYQPNIIDQSRPDQPPQRAIWDWRQPLQRAPHRP
jgi:hypothetical protein